VDTSGVLPDGRRFNDVKEFKQRLLEDERQVARNLVEQLITYATGAAPRFSDRPVIEAILDNTADEGYPIRTLIFQIIASRLFLHK
jgi:(2Fe-2S) ferredoxin